MDDCLLRPFLESDPESEEQIIAAYRALAACSCLDCRVGRRFIARLLSRDMPPSVEEFVTDRSNLTSDFAALLQSASVRKTRSGTTYH